MEIYYVSLQDWINCKAEIELYRTEEESKTSFNEFAPFVRANSTNILLDTQKYLKTDTFTLEYNSQSI
ncbi:hypothetical protein HCJ33_10275 [Listeria seeligeri]|uniref:hypothetical protein n=1 Tax=Listeria seeligeri TaxID=1640 RepID=UPI001627C7DF|nr:hypothetical protein [Listeria seeligeri]MBC1990353.1 hypothetical protein [Listeria seeligeri]